jgi:hypothetical protein
MPLRIWKVTTSFLGARAGTPRMTTCRCCAKSAMRRSRIDKVDKGNMMEYRYFMYGMFDGTDGNRYDICIPSPFVRNSKVEAMKDENFAYRFLAIDSAWPMLIAFANEHFESMNNGKMQLKCWVDKNVVGAYTFEEFKKNGGHIRQLKQSSRGKNVTDESDFVDTDKSFADVFPNMEKGKLYYVDGETYYIGEVVTGAN